VEQVFNPVLALQDNLEQSLSAMRAHKLRSSLTMIGLTMGVATLITVMTIVQGANLYVENKIANLGTNVFQIARTPFAVTDFNIIIKALKYKRSSWTTCAPSPKMPRLPGSGRHCQLHRASPLWGQGSAGRQLYGQSPSMADIDTRAVEFGRYFSVAESEHRANVCLIGDSLVQKLFLGVDPIGRSIRIGTMNSWSSASWKNRQRSWPGPGQLRDRAAFRVLRIQGIHSSLTINVKSSEGSFAAAQDQAQLVLRARRHLSAIWKMIFSSAPKKATWLCGAASVELFSGIHPGQRHFVVIGGIVIMNVMLLASPCANAKSASVARSAPLSATSLIIHVRKA